jgi:hypothetical protein
MPLAWRAEAGIPRPHAKPLTAIFLKLTASMQRHVGHKKEIDVFSYEQGIEQTVFTRNR